MSLFKKKDEDRKEAYKPSDDNVSAKEGSSGGKGGGEPAAPSVDPSTKSGKATMAVLVMGTSTETLALKSRGTST